MQGLFAQNYWKFSLTIRNRHALLQHLREQLVIDWWGHHGIAHWARVRANGLMLAKHTGANIHVVELFSFFHDARRFNEHTDKDHGIRGAALARELRGTYFDATEQEMELLDFACVNHSGGLTRSDPTVLTCWDADRLDLGRVGITVNPKYLGTKVAKSTAAISKANARADAWLLAYWARKNSKENKLKTR